MPRVFLVYVVAISTVLHNGWCLAGDILIAGQPDDGLHAPSKEKYVPLNRETPPTYQAEPEVKISNVSQEEWSTHDAGTLSNNTSLDKNESDAKTDVFQREDVPLLDAVSVKVIVAEEDSIALVDTSTTNRQPFFLERENIDIYSVDFHWNKSLVFFAANNSIFRFDYLANTEEYTLSPIVRRRVDGSVRLAVDWIHDKLYWICDAFQTIEMADFDGNNRRVLADNIKPIRFPNNIAVDPYEKTLFFVSDFALFQCDLDGGNIRHLTMDLNVRGKPGWGIRHVALDRERKTIFVSGKTPETPKRKSKMYIRRVTYAGLGDVENLLEHGTPWDDIYAMEVFNDTLYFVNFNQTRVDRLYAVSLSEKSLTPKLIYVPRYRDNGIWSIRVYHPCVQMVNSPQCQQKY